MKLSLDTPEIAVSNRANHNGSHADGNLPAPIGKVTSPPRHESTADQFFFWVERGRLVEKMQTVHTTCIIEGTSYTFYGVVTEVLRVARQRDVQTAYDRHDGRPNYQPMLHQEGVTYASVEILRVEPDVLTPPLEDSPVFLGDATTAASAYGFGEMEEPLSIGLLKNGATALAGVAQIDLDYLLGTYAGHLNITGMTGAGTKTSFLTILVKLLLAKATSGEANKALHVVPIILNVKGRDLMWIDRPNKEFTVADRTDWEALGVEPTPFEDARFFAPSKSGDTATPDIADCPAQAYCWSLKDVLREELFRHLFDDLDISAAMEALAFDLVGFLTDNDGTTIRKDVPQTWRALTEWLKDQATNKSNVLAMHSPATIKAVYRRLWDVLGASKGLGTGRGLFPLDDEDTYPLRVTESQTCGPLVVDINELPSSLQRFVVAAIVRQLVRARTNNPAAGLRYVLVLDELNRFAPHGAKDGITMLLKEVAQERRSQGIILFGAQQFASQVRTEIVESAAIRVLGRTGPGELDGALWRGWDAALKRQAGNLRREDKLVSLPTLRQPMLVRMPRPPWAMRADQIAARQTLEEVQADVTARSQKPRR